MSLVWLVFLQKCHPFTVQVLNATVGVWRWFSYRNTLTTRRIFENPRSRHALQLKPSIKHGVLWKTFGKIPTFWFIFNFFFDRCISGDFQKNINFFMKNNFLTDKNAFTVISTRFWSQNTARSVFVPCNFFRSLPLSCSSGNGHFGMKFIDEKCCWQKKMTEIACKM